ncbi:MAG: oxidoreductase [Acidobacteriota bacterium]|nr:oxidoreductase [Acidobacteriota bacterium]
MSRQSRAAWSGVLLVAVLAACSEIEPARFEATDQSSGTQARLQAVNAVTEQVVWASGLEGTVVRTVDGGTTWEVLPVAEAESLQFRDVHAFDSERAYLLSAGDGEQSRIYKTEDGGASWTLQFLNLEPEGFLDCFDFWDPDTGIAYGDSVDGELFLLTTSNGGETWGRVAPALLPRAGPDEGGFAASGTCVGTRAGGRVWVGTGAGGSARVLRSSDFGRSWEFGETPIVRGEAAGVMSVVFFDNRIGVAVGGDLGQREKRTANVATTRDGGKTWDAGGPLRFPGPAYGSAVSRRYGRRRPAMLLAAGPAGLDLSLDRGQTWQAVSDDEYWSVDFGGDSVFWAVGPVGKITRFVRPAD